MKAVTCVTANSNLKVQLWFPERTEQFDFRAPVHDDFHARRFGNFCSFQWIRFMVFTIKIAASQSDERLDNLWLTPLNQRG